MKWPKWKIADGRGDFLPLVIGCVMMFLSLPSFLLVLFNADRNSEALGIPLLVHLPNKDWVSKADAEKLAAAGTKILMTIGFGAPVFGVFADDNEPRFRDGKPWPESIVDGVGGGVEAGYAMVIARTLFDAGAILGYCTDTTYDALAGLEHELKSMNVVFSTKDMVQIMGPNTAAYLGMEDQLGTLEPGKIADIVLLDGDPLEGYWNWLKTKVTITEGKVVVDKR